MAFGLVGRKTRLVPVDPDRHLEGCLRWINDDEVALTLGTAPRPVSRPAQREWLENTARSSTDLVWAIETLEGEFLGISSLYGVDALVGTAECGSWIGDPAHRGKGYGSDASRVRARFAFDQRNLHTLYSAYLEGNEASERMLTSVGYREWGRQPNAIYRNGSHLTVVHTFLTREMLKESR